MGQVIPEVCVLLGALGSKERHLFHNPGLWDIVQICFLRGWLSVRGLCGGVARNAWHPQCNAMMQKECV